MCRRRLARDGVQTCEGQKSKVDVAAVTRRETGDSGRGGRRTGLLKASAMFEFLSSQIFRKGPSVCVFE